MLAFNRDVCNDLSASQSREWLETNGIGGYASSTITGLNTRRYHGLLVAATKPPVGRVVLLSKLEETLVLGDRRYELSTNRYPGAVHPQGFTLLKEFRLDPFPTFVFEIEGAEVIKRLFLVHGENTTVVEYEFRGLEATAEATFEIRPLIAFRDFHSTTHRNDVLDPSIHREIGMVSVRPYTGLPTLYFAHDGAEAAPQGNWYFNFEYTVEQERGFHDRDDLFNPFVLRYGLGQRTSLAVVVSTTGRQAIEAAAMRRSELQRRAAIVPASHSSDPFINSLLLAADQFIVKRGELDTVIAGYHWFGDWGRDTMIALPGLTIVTGRYEIARNVLLTFARHADQGMLPNRFPDEGEAPEYNTVDAALWMFVAVQEYLTHTDEWNFLKTDLYTILRQIIEWYQKGTRFGIRMDHDGLLCAGQPGVQLTWMDARVGDFVVTPRQGKPVEIQALWYNALRAMEHFSARLGDVEDSARYAGMASAARVSFNKLFWNEAEGCLYDVVNGDQYDASMRPNQIMAVSLPHTMLDHHRASLVVAAVERELLTPWGLRTLAAKDPQYRGRYSGDSSSRDSAYHQGTVWPWLAGPFFTAWLKVNGFDQAARNKVKAWISYFQQHLSQAGLGQISEIFDGDPPFEPRGCIAQAWSVAEVLRLAVSLKSLDNALEARKTTKTTPALAQTR